MKPSRFLALAGLLSLGSSAANAQSITLTKATLRLFEQESGFVLGPEKRVYTTHFDALTSHFIGVELTIEYAAAPAAFTLTVGCQMTRPDGKVVDGIWKIGARVAAGSTSATDANYMFGGGQTGWQPGIYKVQCAASRNIGEAAFEMTMGPPVVANSEIRLKEVQFFPTGPQVAPVAERKYLDRFSSAEATRIGIELLFVNGSLANSVEVPIDCTYITPTGNVLGTMNFVYKAVPSTPSGTAASGLGWDQPGRWSKGDYLAVCRIQGRPVSVDRFTVW